MSRQPRSESASLTRRRLLAAGGTALLSSVGGCAAVVDFVGEQVLEDVNVLNQLNREVSGSLTVVGPTGETLLDEAFDVPAREATGESNTLAYDGVWRDAGTYRVEVALADVTLEGVSRATATVPIEDPEEEMVAISVGSGDEDEPIAIRVGESLSDLGRPTESR
jgi:hypothetical protein